MNMELFTGLREARIIIENYRRYFYEERLHGALGYVPPREFQEKWLAAHPDFCMGALPPAPRDLTLCASKQRGNGKSRTALEGGPASAPMTGQRSGCVPAEPYPLTGSWIVGEIRT
ncbi:MAG: transposase [Sedimentisphaerales bacterium]|nr:transposase [Sedimentisphaerales bacterium]